MEKQTQVHKLVCDMEDVKMPFLDRATVYENEEQRGLDHGKC